MLCSYRVCSSAHPLFPAAWRVYQVSFPDNEKRSLAAQDALFSLPAYSFTVWHRAGIIAGFIAAWRYADFSYLEHVAVNPEMRSSGYGRAIVKEWADAEAAPVLLEIDPVVDAVSRRRLQFYLSLGFIDDGIDHVQPSYIDGVTPIPMRLLFYPQRFSLPLVERFRHLQHTEMTQSIRDTFVSAP